MDNVAITGRGVISSLGLTMEDFNHALNTAHVAVEASPWVGKQHGLEHQWVSLVKGFDPAKYMDERTVRGTDLFARFSIGAAAEAINDAGVELDPLRTAVVFGTCMSGIDAIVEEQEKLDRDGPEPVSGKMQIKAWPNMAAAQIAMIWQLHGPLLTVSTACASSLDAVGIAARMIEAGQCDMAIAGGADAARSQIFALTGGKYGIYSTASDPMKACIPFDVERSGVINGEGAGFVVLERADRARKRGATIHGYIRGYSCIADASHPSSPEAEGTWEQRTMELALEEARLPRGADQVDAVIAHGTGTPVGDIVEVKALSRLFGKRDEAIPIMSPKGNFGHTVGAAGIMGLFAGLHSMQQNALVPTAGTNNVIPEAKQVRVVTHEPAPTPIKTVQVNAFGFGGQDSSMVVTEA
jgi:3-oxoacyl-[acyl-carrier-protein] synthase II